jgi:DNA-binding CsgD family transcriptional regulator
MTSVHSPRLSPVEAVGDEPAPAPAAAGHVLAIAADRPRPLVGRERECARLKGTVDGARRGQGGVLVLRGEPGSGKTTLLADAAEGAGGMEALTARAADSELDLPFSALEELLRPVLPCLDRLPEQQRAALRGALALGPPRGDGFAVAAATLGLLAEVARSRPVLVVVDDLHWLDRASEQVLLFAARRAGVARVAFLGSYRERAPTRFAGAFDELPLPGLDRASALALLSAVAGTPVAARAAARLLRETGGNPLALVEAARTLDRRALAGTSPLPDPLPLGPHLREAYRLQLEALPLSCRRVLALAAADAEGRVDRIAAAARALGFEEGALVAAEEGGIVSVAHGRIRWRHPLVRSAAASLFTPAELRTAHGALAAASRGAARAWHLAAAAAGPDEEAAGALQVAALEAGERGAPAASALGFERAAELTAEPGARARRLLAAAGYFAAAGEIGDARRVAERAMAASADPLVRADAQLLRGGVLAFSGAPRQARELMLAEAPAVEAFDPARASLMYVVAALTSAMVADIPEALAGAERAWRLAARRGRAEQGLAATQLAQALLLAGRTRDAEELWRACEPLLESADAALEQPGSAAAVATSGWVVDAWLGRREAARAGLERVLARRRGAGAMALLPFPLAWLCEVQGWLGNWRAAAEAGEESIRLAEEAGARSEVAFGLVSLARIEAGLGRERQCREHVTRALTLADRHGADSIVLYAHAAAGLLELGRGRPDDALRHLRHVAALAEQRGLVHPAVVPWAPDAIEAALLAGRRHEAERYLDVLARQAGQTELTWARAVTARSTGLLAAETDGADHFEAALGLHAGEQTPFEHARTQLLYGERLRRRRRNLDAREQLQPALETFEALGAEPWASKTRAELAASGDAARVPRPDATLGLLTGQEREIAARVAEGATNREIAAALYLSPKTVEFHLKKAYAKLGIRSRVELARLLPAGPAENNGGRELGDPGIPGGSGMSDD